MSMFAISVRSRSVGGPMSSKAVSSADVTLHLDLDGVIRQAIFADGVSPEAAGAWVGRRWSETVACEGREKIADMLDDARTLGVGGSRMVSQIFPNGEEVPVEYSTVRLGDSSGLIAIGRNQQARERDFWKLREIETRYRLLFDTSHDAIVALRCDGMLIIEANQAAIRALGLLAGQDFLPDLASSEQEMFRAMLARVRKQGRAPGMVLHLGADHAGWMARAVSLGDDTQNFVLLQLSPISVRPPLRLDDIVQRLPDPFVVIDQDGTILRSNAAFLDLVQIGGQGTVLGQSIGRWMLQSGADLLAFLTAMCRQGHVRRFSTQLRGERSTEVPVEISAAYDNETEPGCIGLIIRDVSRCAAHGAQASKKTRKNVSKGNALLDALGELTGDISHTTLPALVRQAVGLMEKHFIETALEHAGGNRTATAELLGLSRQSLYIKLNRYGLDGGTVAVSDNEP